MDFVVPFPSVSFSQGTLVLTFGTKSIEDCKPNRRMYVDQKKEIVTVTLRSKPPVLRSESADEYTSLHKKLIEEIGPRGAIEAV